MTGTALALVVLLGTTACSQLRFFPAGVRPLLDAAYERNYYALRVSVYFGPFWDDPTLTLLDPRPFDELAYLTLPGGKPLTPGASRGIIPAGTRVRIQAMEMPTPGLILGRPNLSPRYNPWVRLWVNRFDTALEGFGDETYVLVLPATTDADTVKQWMDRLMGPEVEVRDWLAARTPDVRDAIAHKRARVGMTFEELTAALGQPDELKRTFVPEGRQDIARYGSRSVVLLDDVVKTVP